jgi:cation diffusion facilitator family transporter
MKKTRAGYLEGIISIIVNVGLFALKFWAGVVSGSVGLMADAWHSISDSVSSIIVITGAKLASRKADRQHPYGHGRWEQIASMFIAFLLAILAASFFRDSIANYQEGKSADFGWIAISVTIFSVLAKEAMARYAFFLGKKSGNIAVKSDGWHHRTDALSSILVLAGILLEPYFWWIDSALGIIISLMLLYAAYQILREAVNTVLGKRPSDELIREINQIIFDTENRDLKPHQFHIHQYGSHSELVFHIQVERECTVEDAHCLATRIENSIRERLNIEATIHLEPYNGREEEYDPR